MWIFGLGFGVIFVGLWKNENVKKICMIVFIIDKIMIEVVIILKIYGFYCELLFVFDYE